MEIYSICKRLDGITLRYELNGTSDIDKSTVVKFNLVQMSNQICIEVYFQDGDMTCVFNPDLVSYRVKKDGE